MTCDDRTPEQIAKAAYMRKWLASKTQEERDAMNKKRYERIKAKGVTDADRKRNAERMRMYRATMTPEERGAYYAKRKAWRHANPDAPLTVAQKARRQELQRASYAKDPTRVKAQAKKDRARRKAIILAAYGDFCACCGENEIEFLSIDHIKGDGAKCRKLRKQSGDSLYNYLVRNRFPAGFQTLCFNCNVAKKTGAECPHKRIVMSKMNLTLLKGGGGGA
jgi:hypothetical protein